MVPRPGMKKPRSQEPRRAVVLLCLRRQLAPCGAFLLASVKLPCTTTTQRCAVLGFKVYAVSRFTAPVSPLNVRFFSGDAVAIHAAVAIHLLYDPGADIVAA